MSKPITFQLDAPFTKLRQAGLPRFKIGCPQPIEAAPNDLPTPEPVSLVEYREQAVGLLITRAGWDSIAAAAAKYQQANNQHVADYNALLKKHNSLVVKYNDLLSKALAVQAWSKSQEGEISQLNALVAALRNRIGALQDVLPDGGKGVTVNTDVHVHTPGPMQREIVRDDDGNIVRLIDHPSETPTPEPTTATTIEE